MTNANARSLMARLEELGATELRRLLVEHLTRRKLGLYWEATPSRAMRRSMPMSYGASLGLDGSQCRGMKVARWSQGLNR